MEQGTRAVILVEGESDRVALQALAARRGLDLAAAGVSVVPMGGAKGIRAALERYGPGGEGLRVAGLCDAAEAADVRRAVEWAGLGAASSSAEMERLGFFVCHADLEDELIRALGPEGIEAVVEAAGERGRWRTFRRQPQKRGQPVGDQFRRFIGARSGGKQQYAPLLVAAIEPARVPRQLLAVLEHALRPDVEPTF